MSDIDTTSAETTYSGDEAGIRQAAADLEQRRAVAAVDAAYLCAVAQRLLKEQL